MTKGNWLPVAAVVVITALATACSPQGAPSGPSSTTPAAPTSSPTTSDAPAPEPGMPDVANITVDDMCGLLTDDEVYDLLALTGVDADEPVDHSMYSGGGPRCDFHVGRHGISVDIWTTSVTGRKWNTRIAGQKASMPTSPTSYCAVHIRINDGHDLATAFQAADDEDACPVARKAAELVWPRLPR